ncbi:hypothetical protein D3C71_548570 [compost metagenome]
MKSTFIILSFISIAMTSVNAQTNRYDWGIEGGPNLSTFRVVNNPFLDAKPVIFGSGGFIFQYNTKKILSFKTGFSYQRKGVQSQDFIYTNSNGDFIGEGKSVFSFDYITLPLLVKASFGKKVKFFINAGPYAGFLLAKNERGIVESKVVFENKDLTGLKRWDLGAAGGIGVAIPIKEFWMVHAEVRNYFGLQNINDSGNSKSYTNTTDLRLGVVYRLGFRDSE